MFVFDKKYDVIVIGGGHAGVEASLASARMGCATLLLTLNVDTIGQMSCNPAIGGLAKGHLVREIDALGGEMARATDTTGIQFRMLNRKKGPAVQSPRAQCDKKAYQFRMKWVCERQPNLDVKQGETCRILHKDGRAYGVQTKLDVQFHAEVVVVTAGTFLRGLMHIGESQNPGGRSGEGAVTGLSSSLLEIGLELGRLKTGTPPRLARRSIDFDRTEIQHGDEPPHFFSFWNRGLFHMEQSESSRVMQRFPKPCPLEISIIDANHGQQPCFITHTTDETAKLIRANLHCSPLYSGRIDGTGPRYCPSIEDKIVKFPDKPKHQVFLEPEGVTTDEIYVNGLSTSLPFEIQVKLVRTIVGCERAEIIRPAYAVEYDFVFPTQLHPTLETKCCENLFLGGQINGTSGYEEAAAQGLMAGVNAANRVLGRDSVVFRRDQAYIGVLIDDLVTKGTEEPYRMFTSRAEHRLLLRHDNADLRLSDIGHAFGLLPDHFHAAFCVKRRLIEDEVARIYKTQYDQGTLAQLLRRPEMTYQKLPGRNEVLDGEISKQVETAIKYEGYIERQQGEVERFKKLESKQIPATFEYSSVPSLRIEARQKLNQIRPATLGQAARISGVSPSDVGILTVWLKRHCANDEARKNGCAKSHEQESHSDADTL